MISGIIIVFYYGPVYAVICLAYFPLMFLTVILFGNSVKKLTIIKIGMLKKLGGVVEECLFSIRLIVSFN
jgi:ABC-type multidrug transport system fused ATPase/permease subunit